MNLINELENPGRQSWSISRSERALEQTWAIRFAQVKDRYLPLFKGIANKILSCFSKKK